MVTSEAILVLKSLCPKGSSCEPDEGQAGLVPRICPMNVTQIVESVVAGQLKPESELPLLYVGDTINVHTRIVEGDKERIQVYQGVLIGMKGRGINRTITVRRIVANEGVERVFPLHSPKIIRIKTVRRGKIRRCKLYYLRARVGKARKLRERRVSAEAKRAAAEARAAKAQAIREAEEAARAAKRRATEEHQPAESSAQKVTAGEA